MPTLRLQPAFAAGVLGPGLHGRVDLEKYDLGLKAGRNVFIHAHGGVSNRAGTEFIGEVMDHTKTHRLIPFERSDTENFVLLMGDSEMKVIENGAFVPGATGTDLIGERAIGTGTWTLGGVISPTVAQDETGYDGTANAATTLTMASGVYGYARWRETVTPDTSTYTASVYIKKTTSSAVHAGLSLACRNGGGSRTVYSQFRVNPDTGEFWVRDEGFNDTTQDDAAIYDAGDFWLFRWLITNDSSTDIDVELLPNLDPTPGAGVGAWENDVTGSIVFDNAQLFLGNKLELDYVATTPFASTDLMDLDYVQSVDVMFFAHQSYFPRKMTRTGTASYTFANIETEPQNSPPTTGITSSITAYGGGGSETQEYTYVITALTADGTESFQSASTSVTGEVLEYEGQEVTISWDAVAGADTYNVYRKRAGSFGYIGYTEETSLIDDNISPDLTYSPPQACTYFLTSSDYPAAVTIFQQRLAFANTANNPETIFFSRIGDYENFTQSEILRDSDAFEMDVTGGSVNRVKYLTQLRELLVFASTGEWSIIGPNGGLPATNPGQQNFGYSGSGGVKPLVAEDTTLFVDRTGRNVRDLRYAFEQDGYAGNDLTIFAYHFFEGKTITSWAAQKNPYGIVWVALSDGTLLSFTYKREHQVWAWAEHDVGGEVESLAVITEGDEESLYMIVKRTINGGTKRYVERLHTRNFATIADAFFVDCGLTYDGTATTTITGLDHLEGEAVVALADGNVFESLTVSSGQVTLPEAASKVHVGLYNYSEIETLDPPIQLQDVGSSKGRPIKASKVVVQVEKTRGIKAGPSGGTLNEYIQTDAEDMSADIEAETGVIEVRLHAQWSKSGSVKIRQDYPLPMTILGIAPDYSIGRTAG